MKKSLLVTILLGALTSWSFAQTRFLDEVFTDVDVTSDMMYGANISVLSGSPALDTLRMDVYEPAGDTMSARPVVIFVHTGSFLPPPLNGSCTGTKLDSNIVETCSRLAKMGYVAAAIEYRLGWNPAGDQDTRTGTLINAVYRGLQDTKNAVRFFRWSVDSLNNQFAVDPDKISLIGQGTGGYITLAYASLDKPAEITLPKFTNANNGEPYVDTTLSGNYDGTNNTPLNVANFPTYSNEVCLVSNLGGALGDSTWLEAGDAPVVSFHCPNDPFAPYSFGSVIVPTTGDFVVDVSGSYDVVRIANDLGNNDVFVNANLSNSYTVAANADNDGRYGLFPFIRPTPESAPWQWWDPNCSQHSNDIQTNPDMSKSKAMAYIDTIMGYLAPRMALACGLETGVGYEEYVLNKNIQVFPNPTNNILNITSNLGDNKIEFVEVFDGTGRLVRNESVQAAQHQIETADLPAGFYMVRIQMEEGAALKKVLVQ